jgi:hypothetical protein
MGSPDGLTWPHILSADVRRLRTLRSTWWFTVAIVLLTVVTGATPALGVAVGALEGPPEEVAALGGSLGGIGVAQLLVAAFAVLAVTAEYATGAVTSTFTAVPRRAAVVVSRAAVVTAGVLALSLGITFTTFAVAHALLATAGLDLPLTASGVVRSLIGAAMYLAVVAALATAFGWLLRSTVGALAAVIGLFQFLPVIGFFLPAAIARQVLPWLPSNAAGALMAPQPMPGMLPTWTALAALIGYVVAALVLAAVTVRRRDI